MARASLLLASMLSACAFALAAAAPAAADVTWLCHPGLANDPCEIPLDTTLQTADGATVQTPARAAAADRPVDCFFVYPTVSSQVGINASKARDPELLSIAKYQASRFSTKCRMFAPIYRQITFVGIPAFAAGSAPGSPAGTAYLDVLEAWRQYLAQDNGGRGVVLIGHSQGTMMLRELIGKEIDTHPEQQRLLVGGVLPGENVTVRNGATTGGDFAHTPICTRRGEAGCVVAYSTYSTNPGLVSFFGRDESDLGALAFGFPTGADYHVACTDPGPLSGLTGPVGITVPSEPFAAGPINAGIAVTRGGAPPTAPTTWVQPPDRYEGACQTIGGADVYRYNPVGSARRPNEFPPTWGTHLLDINLGLERLTTIVGLQADTWLATALRLPSVRRNPRSGTATASVAVPGAGLVSVVGSKRVRPSSRRVTGPQLVKLPVVLWCSARRELTRKRRTRVRVTIRYTPATGAAATVARTITVKLARP